MDKTTIHFPTKETVELFERLKKSKVSVGWCKVWDIAEGTDPEDEEFNWTIGNVREVGETECRVEIPEWDEETCVETIEEWFVHPDWIEMKEQEVA